MNKKILAVILTAALVIGGTCVSAFANSGYSLAEQAGVLKSLGVMQGDPDGNLRLNDTVTRAEYTKMITAMSAVRNAASSSLSVSPFSDVPYTHWAAPYVRLAVSNGYVSGYTDSTFRPQNNVTYAEAVTIALKLLGYTNDDFGAAWPYGQMGTAENLGLTKDITGGFDSPLSRGACVILLNNLLDTKLKGSSQKYAGVIDCEIKEGIILIATKNEDATVAEGKVFTTAGTFKISDNVSRDYIGARGDALVRNGDEIISFISSGNGRTEKMVVYSTLNDVVIGYEGGELTQVTVPAATTAYVGASVSNYAAAQQKLNMGSVVTFQKDLKGNIEYICVNEGATLQGPMIVSGGAWYSPYCDSLDGVTVIRSGVKASASELKINDVAYYTPELKMMFVYSNPKTGIYESASPNKDMPSSVTVSGVTYQIEGAAAFTALSSTGALKYGDSVTLLLGKDGKVAGAVAAGQTADSSVCGYIIGSGKKNFTDSNSNSYSSYYIELVTPDGLVNEYPTATNSSKYVNRVVKIDFKNGKATIKSAGSASGVSGIVDASAGKIGSSEIASDANILDVSSVSGGDISLYKKVYLKRLDGAKINNDSVLYYTKNSSGEINNLILLDVTGDLYSYGYVQKADKQNQTYTIDVDGTGLTVTGGFTAVSSGSPAKFTFKGGVVSAMSLGAMSSLSALKGTVESISAASLTAADGKDYLISDSTVVYARGKNVTNYTVMPLNDLVNDSEKYRITAYYDKAENAGGRIRVLLAVER